MSKLKATTKLKHVPKLNIRRGDRVAIISGKDAGSDGRVLDVLPKKGRIIVEGINKTTRHEKIQMNRRGTQEGGISHKETSVDISNVALICPTDGPTRVGSRHDEAGARVRVCVKCGAEL
jgi:large subunit ribosomal protein L24